MLLTKDGPYLIPLARGTGRFLVDSQGVLAAGFRHVKPQSSCTFRKPSWGNRPTSSCRNQGRQVQVRCEVCYMLSVSPFPVSVANKGFFGDPLKSRGWWLGGGETRPSSFVFVILWKKFTSQREGKILTSHHGASFQSRRQCAEELQVQFADGSNRPGWRRDLPLDHAGYTG